MFILKLFLSLIIFFTFYFLGVFFKKTFYNRLVEWAKSTKLRADDVVVGALKNHIFLWIILIGVYLAALPLFPSSITSYLVKILIVIFIASLTFALSRIASGLIKTYADKLQTTVAMSGMSQTISRSVIFILGFLMILNSLGISITPLLTTLGIGGLAVALALQDTLSNFFAGFHIILAKQIRIGDYIKLESGEEGYVVDINWRTTKIRMLPNNIVLIPNSKLSQSIITNYYLPEKEMAVLVQVGVHYESDLEEVERVVIEVGEEVMREVGGGVGEFKPFIRYHTFGDFSINFTVILRAREFVDQYMVKHEFIKRLHRRFKEKNICIPFPITALNVTQEEAHKYFKS